MKENSFSAKRPVFLGAGVGRAETGPCLHVGACSYLARPPETLPGQPQAPNHPRSPHPAHPSSGWRRSTLPPLSLSFKEALGPICQTQGHRVLERTSPKEDASSQPDHNITGPKTAPRTLGREAGEAAREDKEMTQGQGLAEPNPTASSGIPWVIYALTFTKLQMNLAEADTLLSSLQ